MNCPSCGAKLAGTSVVGSDDSWRCPECGGAWMAPWVVNQIADGKDVKIQAGNKSKLIGGKNVCPEDGDTVLARPRDVAGDVNCWSCYKCGWWWFTGDEVFKFAEAYKLKKKYSQVWGGSLGWQGAILPALATLILVVGLFEGVLLVQRKNQLQSQAMQGVMQFSANYLGNGIEEVSFGSTIEVNYLTYKKSGDIQYQAVTVESANGKYTAKITGLTAGDYDVGILDKTYTFTVR